MSYKASKIHGDIAEQLQAANRAFLFVATVKRMTALTKGTSLNVCSCCKSLTPGFDPANTTYLSSSSQNELIGCCSMEVTAQIIKEVKESKMYAVMADKAKDGHTEQLAVFVRYVSLEGDIKKRFLCLQKLDNYGAEAITNAVEQVLVSNDIAELKVVAQTYDSAAVMSGSGRACTNIKHPMVMSVALC